MTPYPEGQHCMVIPGGPLADEQSHWRECFIRHVRIDGCYRDRTGLKFHAGVVYGVDIEGIPMPSSGNHIWWAMGHEDLMPLNRPEPAAVDEVKSNLPVAIL